MVHGTYPRCHQAHMDKGRNRICTIYHEPFINLELSVNDEYANRNKLGNNLWFMVHT